MIYIASRVRHAAEWRNLRDQQSVPFISSWIDEAGQGESPSLAGLWDRVAAEVRSSHALILYAEQEDVPLKGALVEVGMALVLSKPVFVVLRGITLEERSMRPIGSWLHSPLVRQCNDVATAIKAAIWLADVRTQAFLRSSYC